jgi:putative SOS response-associated peptidase YedK
LPGRLFLTAPVAEIAARFGADPGGVAEPGPRTDVAPGEVVAAVVAGDGGRRLVAMRWGMIPMGRTNARGRPVMETIVNARSETLFAKSAFKGVRRAILPVGGWYEWTGPTRRKTRWAIAAPDAGLLAFAAVWDAWAAPGGAEVLSLATVTCPPNAEVAAVHDRMPVILEPEGFGLWLGEADGNPAGLMRTLGDGRLRVTAAA